MDSAIKNLDEALEESMVHLVQIMRHLLGNIHEEQHAFHHGNTLVMNLALLKRTEILKELEVKREKMSEILLQYDSATRDMSLENLADIVGEDKITLLNLKEQILALTNSIEHDMSAAHSMPPLHVATEQQHLHHKQELAVLDPESDIDVE